MKRRFEVVHLAPGAEDGVVELDGLREDFLVGDDDVGVGHGAYPIAFEGKSLATMDMDKHGLRIELQI